MIIAIDGPAGSGKSTVAKRVAERLGFHYLDTGAMYRAVAWRALEQGVSLADESGVSSIAHAEEISFEHEGAEALPSRVFIGGREATEAIRTPRVDDAVSAVAAMAAVREAMVEQQRHIGGLGDTVVEGRDIGTVVFPDADVKVFLTASAEERARRRAVQHAEGGHSVDTTGVLEAMRRRDRTDSTREVSPLTAAGDAVELDTTGLTIAEVVEKIAELAEKAADKRGKPSTGPEVPNWSLAWLVRNTVGKLLLALYRVRFIGAENVPRGGAVLAGNHVSYLDPVLMWCGTPRPTHFMAKVELWSIGWLGWVLDQFWAFPVDRTGADREAIATGTRLLEHGELVGIFPEGTRKRDGSDELGEAQGGAAFVALRAGVPIVPVGIIGTDRAWPPGARFPRLVRVTVRYGEPVRPEDFEGSRKDKVAAMTAETMRRIAEERRRGSEA